jgi:arylsulfatase A-like enzyme
MKHSCLTLPALLLGALTPLEAAEVKPDRPNVIVILMDDMGYGDIGPFGSKLNRTPNLDRLAAEGMKLTSFYAAPLCTASRSQLMTGCYAKRVGMPDVLFPVNKTGISPSEKTIADLVKPLGYATMIIGKWHLGDQPEFLPTRHGFDHYLGLPYSNDMDGGTKPGGKNPMPPLPLLRDEKVIAAPADQDKLTELYTGEAVKFITANKDRPFFLYLPHAAVHVPLHPGPAFKGKSKNGDYGDWVEEADWSVGRVLTTLRELKLNEKTLVIFASDNGGTKNVYNGPLRGTKFTTWEGGVRVPALVRWTGRIPAGSTCDAMLSELDLLPTVVNLAGGKVPTDRKIDGVNIRPVLTGQRKDSPHEALYFWRAGGLEAVRSGPWKLAIAGQEDKALKKSIDASRQVPRLYHLDRDVGEADDVATQHPDVVNRLQALIAKMDADLGIGKGRIGRGPGARPAGHVDNPKPLLMRTKSEYD